MGDFNMRNLLTGNGTNIRFSGKEYTNKEIILRILRWFDRVDYPTHIIVDDPYLIKNYLGTLFLEARSALQGKYDKYALTEIEKKSLNDFKDKYKNAICMLTISDIGYEDYYLIHELFCRKIKASHSETFEVQRGLRFTYLYSIFNDGKINQVYQKYSSKYIEYLCDFNNIFTTNYDSNIEQVVNCNVYHIHGSFDKIDSIYDKDFIVNQLFDDQAAIIIDPEYFYLYSNALTTFAGQYKEFQVKRHSLANEAIIKFSNGYITDNNIKKAIEEFTHSSNKIVRRLGEIVKMKVANPDIEFSEDYHFDKLLSMSGELEILGLSPWNDFHIFEAINNSAIEKCIYHYYNSDEMEKIKCLLPNLTDSGRIFFSDAKLFWEKCYER